jgi:hypothetical protein
MVEGVPTSLLLVKTPSDWAPTLEAATRSDTDVRSATPGI